MLEIKNIMLKIKNIMLKIKNIMLKIKNIMLKIKNIIRPQEKVKEVTFSIPPSFSGPEEEKVTELSDKITMSVVHSIFFFGINHYSSNIPLVNS